MDLIEKSADYLKEAPYSESIATYGTGASFIAGGMSLANGMYKSGVALTVAGLFFNEVGNDLAKLEAEEQKSEEKDLEDIVEENLEGVYQELEDMDYNPEEHRHEEIEVEDED